MTSEKCSIDPNSLWWFSLMCDFTYVYFPLSKPIRALDPCLARKKPYVLFLKLAVAFSNNSFAGTIN